MSGKHLVSVLPHVERTGRLMQRKGCRMDIEGIALIAAHPVQDSPALLLAPPLQDDEFERLMTADFDFAAAMPKATIVDRSIPQQNDPQTATDPDDILPDLQFAALISGYAPLVVPTRAIAPAATNIVPGNVAHAAVPVGTLIMADVASAGTTGTIPLTLPDSLQAPPMKPPVHAGPSQAVTMDTDPALIRATDVTPGPANRSTDAVLRLSGPDIAASQVAAPSNASTALASALPTVAALAAHFAPGNGSRNKDVTPTADPLPRPQPVLDTSHRTQPALTARGLQERPVEAAATPVTVPESRSILTDAPGDLVAPDNPVMTSRPSDDAIPARDHAGVAKEMQTARHIAHQIAAEVTTIGTGKTEIVLDPAELGRVKLSLQAIDQAITVYIQADRTETTELMRRHIDQLADEFRTLGYQDIRFSFSGQSDRQTNHWQGGAPPDASGPDANAAFEFDALPRAQTDSPTSGRTLSGSLDLRL